MIADLVIGFFLDLAGFLVGLLPTADPIGLTEFSGIWTGYAFLNGFLPITETLQAVAAILGIQLAIYGGQAILQLWRAMPGKMS